MPIRIDKVRPKLDVSSTLTRLKNQGRNSKPLINRQSSKLSDVNKLPHFFMAQAFSSFGACHAAIALIVRRLNQPPMVGGEHYATLRSLFSLVKTYHAKGCAYLSYHLPPMVEKPQIVGIACVPQIEEPKPTRGDS